MNQIEVLNWQGKKIPDAQQRADKTIFLSDKFFPQNANLVLYPLESAPARHLKKIAAYIRMDRNILKSRLSGRGFMMLKRSENTEEITACVNELNGLGYRARMLRDNMFFRLPAPRRVVSLELGPGGAFFKAAGSDELIGIPLNEPVFCIIADIRCTGRLAAIKQSDANPSPAPGGTGFSFLPIFDKISTYHCDLYFPYKWIALRIESDKFNFACLGDKAAQNSAENLALLLDRLCALPLKMVWDDRFPETAVIGMRTQFELATSSNSVVSTSVQTNPAEAPFNFYSRFRYILELASGLKCFS